MCCVQKTCMDWAGLATFHCDYGKDICIVSDEMITN